MTDAPAAAAAATAAPAATTPAAAATATPTTPQAFDWAANGVGQEHAGYVQNKGWKGPGDLLTSYVNLEKLVGAPPESIVRLPQGEFNQELFNTQVADRLGRPKTAADYKLEVPQGQDTKFAETASAKFHELGLTERQGQALAKWWNETTATMTKGQSDAKAASHAQQVTELKTEWGKEYDAKAANVEKAAAAFGMTPEHLAALKEAMGPKGAMKFMDTIGSRLGVNDQNFHTGDNRTTTFTGGMSPEQAKARVAELRKDAAWVSRYAAGGVAEKAEMERLMRTMSPGELTI